jgi:DNA-binding protein H-NS
MSKMPDFSQFSAAKLNEWRAEIDACLEKAEEADAKAEALRAQIQKMVEDAGISIDRVLGHNGTTKGVMHKAKYANPDNPKQTWTGQGNMPRWALDLTGGVQLKGKKRQKAMAKYLIQRHAEVAYQGKAA